MILLYIAVGGALGALARYGLGGWVHDRLGAGFPWGTLAVNLLGCFALGMAIRSLEGLAVSSELRAMITVGFMGAFTTFSTFSYETAALLQDGEWERALLYLGASVLIGLLAMFAGLAAGGLGFRR